MTTITGLPTQDRALITSPLRTPTRLRKLRSSGFVHPTTQLYATRLVPFVRRNSSRHGQRRRRIGFGKMRPRSEVEYTTPAAMRRSQKVDLDLEPALVLVRTPTQEALGQGQDVERLWEGQELQTLFWGRERLRYVQLDFLSRLRNGNIRTNLMLYRKMIIAWGLMLESKQNLYHDTVLFSLPIQGVSNVAILLFTSATACCVFDICFRISLSSSPSYSTTPRPLLLHS